MSFRRGKAKASPTEAGELQRRLQAEFDTPSATPDVQPIIVAEPDEPEPISRLFVIWDDWQNLSLQDRSEIIMNAYQGAKGQAEAIRIAVALGLTTAEAKRMGIAS